MSEDVPVNQQDRRTEKQKRDEDKVESLWNDNPNMTWEEMQKALGNL